MQTDYSTNQTNVKYLDINYELELIHTLDHTLHTGVVSLPESAFSELWLGWIDKHCEDVLRVIAQRIYDHETGLRQHFHSDELWEHDMLNYIHNGGVYIICEINGYKIAGNAYTLMDNKNVPHLDVEFVAAEKM